MPRKSVEALAGAWWRAQEQHGSAGRPKAPAWLPKEAAQLFTEVVNSRAPDLFMPGSIELLAQFCMFAWVLRRLWEKQGQYQADSPQALKIGRMIGTLTGTQCRLAECCALLPRHTHGRRSGVLSERYSGGDGKVAPRLLGGKAAHRAN
jgi:hypothetical protein